MSAVILASLTELPAGIEMLYCQPMTVDEAEDYAAHIGAETCYYWEPTHTAYFVDHRYLVDSTKEQK